jgi:hypothetical protein
VVLTPTLVGGIKPLESEKKMPNIVKAYSYSDVNSIVEFHVDIDEFEHRCKTCKEELDEELGCVNCFCIQYWNLNESSIPTDIKHLRIER